MLHQAISTSLGSKARHLSKPLLFILLVSFNCAIILILVILSSSYGSSYNLFMRKNTIYNNRFYNTKLILTSKCECRSEKVIVSSNETLLSVKKIFPWMKRESQQRHYMLESKGYYIPNVTCDLFNVLRRGPGQKVIAYSLYGTHPKYYDQIKPLLKMAAEYYSDWVLRIYYDDSINKSLICDIECMKDEFDRYYDNVDFCYSYYIPNGFDRNVLNASYLHSMKWRWLPLGDPFVNMFLSRDTDSWLTRREYDSVREWLLNTQALFHIMRGKWVGYI